MEKQIFSKRAFINKEGYHSNASIVANIEKATFGGDAFYAIYKLSDCSRTVEISIDISDMEEYENTLYKLDKILEVTKSFRDAVVKLEPGIKEAIAHRKAASEKEKNGNS